MGQDYPLYSQMMLDTRNKHIHTNSLRSKDVQDVHLNILKGLSARISYNCEKGFFPSLTLSPEPVA